PIQDGKLYVFTTRADTIMGVTFCAVAPEHPLAVHAAATNPALAAFIAECKRGSVMEADMATMEKKGMPTGMFVEHPLTGDKVEVWVGNYVLMSYGDGAVMGVPAHDERDFAFALKYGIEIKQVVGVAVSGAGEGGVRVCPVPTAPAPGAATDATPGPVDVPAAAASGTGHTLTPAAATAGTSPSATTQAAGRVFDATTWHDWYADKTGALVCVNSGELDGLSYKAAVTKVAELLAAQDLGAKKTTWRLRDWGISRQRYWGTPIPIIHCDSCGSVPVPEADLPVRLPEDVVPDGSGNPLKSRPDFLNVGCPKCGKPAQRETDTMDTFVDSSWYFLRYTCTQSQSDGSACASDANQMVDARTDYWMGAANAAGNRGMDQYIGGIEHAILHLLYARFWTKVMRDLGLVQIDEPFKKLLTQGMVLNHIYSRKTAQGGIEYFWPHEVEHTFDANGKIIGAKLKSDGSMIDYGGVGTMSKSKNNGVDPQELIDTMGADTARLFTMFASPPEQTLEWNDAGVEGAHRFVKRVWNFGAKNAEAIKAAGTVVQGELTAEDKALRREVYVILKQISYDYERMQYNTVASGAMKLLNLLETQKDLLEGWASSPDEYTRAGVNVQGALAVVREGFGVLLRGLYPACPHLTHVLWEDLGYAAKDGGDLLDAPWPKVVEEALVQDEIELMLQVNGKLRGAIKVSPTADKAAIEAAALASEDFVKFSEGKAPKKVIIVPGRLVNLVV
ncbi:MAG: hypothetical protein RI920_767, partial [Pseudomonadota bacterium]